MNDTEPQIEPNSKSQNDRKLNGWLLKPQSKLGTFGLTTLLLLANIIIPCSIDMYTPALPSLPAYFNTTETVVNLTLLSFTLFLALGMLVFGAVSDRFGRKPVLVLGLATYTLGGLACALAWSVYALIAFRIVQAIGAGATVSVSTALVKDCFQPDKREKVLSILQVLNVVGPVAAPLLGGFLLRFFPWRGNFVALAIFGAICFVLSLAFEETLPVDERRQGGIISTLSGLVVVGKNRAFMQYLVAMGLLNTAFMGYIVSSSYIYQDYFGTSPQGYTYFFALTAGLASLGPIIWLRISSHTTPRRYTFVVLFLCLASGVLIITLGGTSAPLFCGLFAIFTTAQSSMRPFSTNIMLAQQKRDTGSAASLINFTISIFGVMGMSLVQISWPHYILGLGLQVTLCTLLSIFLYVTLLKSKKVHIAELEK